MKRFIYKAKDAHNKLVTGDVEASSIEIAAKLLHQKGFVIILLKPKILGPIALLKRYQERITAGQVATLTRQLSTMVNAGLPVTQGISILRTQSKGTMQQMLNQILADVEGGDSFSKALSKYPKVFTTTYIALIKSGELGGVLDKVLLRLADSLEKQEEFNAKVKTAFIYPTIIIIGMVAVSFIMMIFVVPKLTSLYTDFKATLPLPTRVLIAISNFSVHWWPLVIIAGLLGYYLFTLYKQTSAGKRQIDELIFKLPIFGELSKQIILTELTRTLALMVASGVSILEALGITSSVVSNGVISEALKDSAKQVEKGFPVSFAFARHPEAFPYLLWQMVSVGEETGKMDEVLTKVSNIFELESDQKVKGLTAAIEPIVMVVLGAGVAFLVISIILPIYNLTSSF